MYSMISVLLLGPGHPENQLKIREDIQKIVNKYDKKNAIIMEQICKDTEIPLHKAFEKLLKIKNPDFIVALYTKDGFHNAVDFELGTLTCHFNDVKEKLLILTDKELPEEKITRYLRDGLYYKIIQRDYNTIEDAAKQIIIFMNTH